MVVRLLRRMFSIDQVLIKYFFIFRVSKEYIGIVVFCIPDYTSRIQIHSILIEFLENFRIALKSPGRTKHVCNLRWRSISSKLEKSLKVLRTAFPYSWCRESLCRSGRFRWDPQRTVPPWSANNKIKTSISNMLYMKIHFCTKSLNLFLNLKMIWKIY